MSVHIPKTLYHSAIASAMLNLRNPSAWPFFHRVAPHSATHVVRDSRQRSSRAMANT
jgi:hypothetical protein